MRTTYQYRGYPTTAQVTSLRRTLATCRWVYNTMLATKRAAWATEQRMLSKYDVDQLADQSRFVAGPPNPLALL